MAFRRRPTGSDFGAGGGARRNDPLFTPKSDNGDDDDGVDVDKPSSPSSSSWLAAQAIRASSANRGSSLSSAYSSPPLSTTNPVTNASATATASSPSFPSPKRDSEPYQYTSIKNLNESKHGFWGNLARKAKAFLDDDDVSNSPQHDETPQTQNTPATDSASGGKYYNEHRSYESRRKPESPAMQKGLGAITSSLNYIGGTIGSAVEEGIIKVENRTAGLIQETRKHIRKKPGSSAMQDQGMKQPYFETQGQSQPQTDLELQLKASRDVAMAMAAKAKLLLRELKTVKADLAFAKERCAQLEEENRMHRENRHREDGPENDDLIRLQLETLLAEKARLAHENSVYARENRFLREVVEYHQLTMQDVVYLDEGSEEVTEVYPIKVVSAPQPTSPLNPEGSVRDMLPHPTPPPEVSSQSAASSPSFPRRMM